MTQISGSDRLDFAYDEAGNLYGFFYQNTPYLYVRNGQGDITGILDATGKMVVNYEYDSWGNITKTTDSTTAKIGTLNPFRYRGYYYDNVSGLYYLQSRYYDAGTGRFVNADGQLNTSLGLSGINMFAYYINNPVNMIDIGGNKPGDLFDSIDEAARDFAICYNGVSISDNLEYATSIYQVITFEKTYVNVTMHFLWWNWDSTITVINLKIKYSYTTIKKGNNEGVVVPAAPLLKKRVATAHTHAAYDPSYDNDIFSNADKVNAKSRSVPNYVATRLGILRKYNSSDGSDIQIFDDIPFDINHPRKK